jgi:oxygen-independent coproporphyrinogen-3 oxidase
LLHFTRRLAALHIDKATFSQLFGTSAWKRYSEKFDLLVAEGLFNESRQAYSLTPRGMFFSDSISALLAEGRWQDRSDLPRAGSRNDNSYGHM